MKKIIIFLSVALLLSLGVNAQRTLSTETFSEANNNMPNINDNFNAPINVTNIGNVNVLTVYYEFNDSVLDYDTIDNTMSSLKYSVEFETGTTNVLKIVVSNPAGMQPIVIPDGKLLDIKFNFLGGYTALTFWTVEYGTYASNILEADYFTTFNFTDADVTNGAVEGYFDNEIDGGDWHTASNWSLNTVPDMHHNVTVANGSETTAGVAAEVNNLTINPGGQLTVTSLLNVYGDFTIESDATGDGSFINNGGALTVTGTTTVERYAVNGQWHGLSSPVVGATFATTYFGGNPEVWVKKYNEPTDDYTYLVDTTAVMQDMTGYFTWIQTSGTPQTYTFEGLLRNGTVTSGTLNNTNTGHAFIGNPYASAIDWDAASGWTKYHINDAIYVYDGAAGQFMSYVAGVGLNGGTQYIAMGQGFFVQVDNSFTTGGVDMTIDVCVHNTVGFKETTATQDIVRLEVEDAGKTDETVIRFTDDATAGFDGDLDAHKMFSLTDGMPQLYSTANSFMGINSLPYNKNLTISLDVKGTDGDNMTIKATEDGGKEHLYLKDNYTSVVTDLKSGDYTFTYHSAVTNRFELFFGYNGIDNPTADYAKIYAVDNSVKVVLDNGVNADITVYNLLGQRVAAQKASGTVTTIAVEKTGYYLVKVNDGANVTTQKVFIR